MESGWGEAAAESWVGFVGKGHACGRLGQYVQPGATGTVVQMWELLRARVLGREIAGLSMMMLVDKWEKAEGPLEPREWPWT